MPELIIQPNAAFRLIWMDREFEAVVESFDYNHDTYRAYGHSRMYDDAVHVNLRLYLQPYRGAPSIPSPRVYRNSREEKAEKKSLQKQLDDTCAAYSQALRDLDSIKAERDKFKADLARYAPPLPEDATRFRLLEVE